MKLKANIQQPLALLKLYCKFPITSGSYSDYPVINDKYNQDARFRVRYNHMILGYMGLK